MVKPADEVITQFNELVNMSPEELETWLNDPQSKKAGTGVGIESGHKIIAIMRNNPSKDPDKYEEVSGLILVIFTLENKIGQSLFSGGYWTYAQGCRVSSFQTPNADPGTWP